MTQCSVFSYGGGVQSNAVLVLQAEGKLLQPYDYFIFSNVGFDSENPATLEYVEHEAKPYAAKHGIEFITVQKMRGRKKAEQIPDTLLSQINRQQKSFVIPVRMGHNGAPGNRNCTEDFKISVVGNAIKAMGFTHAIIGLGISVDEFSRARSLEWYEEQNIQKRREYPLLDLRLGRSDCLRIIQAAGLSEPPKSSCWLSAVNGSK